MSTSPFGAAGFGFPAFDPATFERLGRQWFAAMSPQPAAPAAPDPFAWWKPAAPPTPASGFDPTALANQWMTQMQQLAAQFGGSGEAQAADIARAWRSMLGDNPFAQGGFASAFMPAAFFGGANASRAPFDLPAFGYTREHQERMQAFAKATGDFQQASQAFNAIIAEAGQGAFSRFESLLAKRGTDGKPVETARALFDLWIDAAEDAYADIALSDRFQAAFGDYINAQMRVRAAMQKEVELACAQWGIPGRAEVDAAHRKVAQLERELRRLREVVEAMSAPPPRDPEPAPAAQPRAAKAAPRKTGKR
ncbi:poly(R)-hydroxyalkanoic acid synthase subunit PhaE [Lysobacter claricitrinus]|uniref:poly(R)-hydroxyalkanoic acid synthase subunit PhaE n=1 Tax=Lysobacter claricitrinus TaxID=3367728 RepID=UPI0037DB1D9B